MWPFTKPSKQKIALSETGGRSICGAETLARLCPSRVIRVGRRRFWAFDMSAVPPIATELVRPDELTRCAKRRHMHRSRSSLFDHLVGEGELRWKHFEAERSRGVEVDHQLEFRGRLHRKLGWLFIPEDAIHIARRQDDTARSDRARSGSLTVPGEC
jgi:hypothetical protein